MKHTFLDLILGVLWILTNYCFSLCLPVYSYINMYLRYLFDMFITVILINSVQIKLIIFIKWGLKWGFKLLQTDTYISDLLSTNSLQLFWKCVFVWCRSSEAGQSRFVQGFLHHLEGDWGWGTRGLYCTLHYFKQITMGELTVICGSV